MQDIEALTERILLIGRGQILLDGTLDELKSRNAQVRRMNVLYAGGYFDPVSYTHLFLRFSAAWSSMIPP